MSSLMRLDDLISRKYLGEQVRLHAAPQGYGGRGAKWADTICWLVTHYTAASVLDYGCGQGSLGAVLTLRGLVCRDYDPAIAGKDDPPRFADIVVCTDVLEHVEPDRLDAVLTHIRQLARRAVFLVVNLRESNKTLTDGRNAHIILESAEWWAAKVQGAGFTVQDLPDLPIPSRLLGEKRSKFWLAVVTP